MFWWKCISPVDAVLTATKSGIYSYPGFTSSHIFSSFDVELLLWSKHSMNAPDTEVSHKEANTEVERQCNNGQLTGWLISMMCKRYNCQLAWSLFSRKYIINTDSTYVFVATLQLPALLKICCCYTLMCNFSAKNCVRRSQRNKQIKAWLKLLCCFSSKMLLLLFWRFFFWRRN